MFVWTDSPSTVTAAADPYSHYTTLEHYVSASFIFTELRLCPCFNMIPRAIMEHMNCLATPGSELTLSSSYHSCQAIDMDLIYSDPLYFPMGMMNGLQMVRVPCF